MEKMPSFEKPETLGRRLIRLLKEYGLDDPRAKEALLEWTLEREKEVEQSDDYRTAQIELNLKRAQLYFEAGLFDMAFENFDGAMMQAWKEGLDDMLFTAMDEKRRVWDDMYRLKEETGSEYWQIDESDLERMLELFPGAKTSLDLACGSGQLSFQLAHKGLSVTGTDFSGEAVRQANKKKGEISEQLPEDKLPVFEVMDDMDWFVPEGRYDVVFLKLAFAFVRGKDVFLERMKPVIRQGLVIITPVLEPGKEYSDREKDYSVPAEEMDDLLQQHFGHYDRIDLQGKTEGSMIPAFIVRLSETDAA